MRQDYRRRAWGDRGEVPAAAIHQPLQVRVDYRRRVGAGRGVVPPTFPDQRYGGCDKVTDEGLEIFPAGVSL